MQIATIVFGAYALMATADGHTLFNPVPSTEISPMTTERATQADSAFTVAPGHVQLETEVFALGSATDGATSGQLDLVRTLVRVGLVENVDLQMLLPALSWTNFGSDAGKLDASDAYTLRGKWNLLGNDGAGLSLALLPWVRIPVDETGIAAGLSVPLGGVVWEKLGLGGIVTFYGNNLGVSPQLQTFASGYASWDFGSGVSAFGDLSADVDTSTFNTAWKASTGLIWQFHPNMQVDTGLIADLFNAAPQFAWFTGFSIRG